MTPFVEILREAHAITVSHAMGDVTVGAICQRTRLPLPTVLEWAKLLRLPLQPQGQSAVYRESHPGIVLDTITSKEHI
jgi:hypothetical protein